MGLLKKRINEIVKDSVEQKEFPILLILENCDELININSKKFIEEIRILISSFKNIKIIMILSKERVEVTSAFDSICLKLELDQLSVKEAVKLLRRTGKDAFNLLYCSPEDLKKHPIFAKKPQLHQFTPAWINEIAGKITHKNLDEIYKE